MRLRNYLVIFILTLGSISFGQEEDKSQIWLKSILTDPTFNQASIEFLESKDLSNIISNCTRFNGDPLSYYSGVFGSNYKRIDFLLTATKQPQSTLIYNIKGFNKLGSNVRPIEGFMTITCLRKLKDSWGDADIYLVVFDCKFYEPGSKVGGGSFSGIYTTVLYSKNNDFSFMHSDSGDFSFYSGVFVGNWREYNTSGLKSVIFSFDPIGLYGELPLCSEFYESTENPDYVLPKDKYVDNGWTNYNSKDSDQWWKNNN